MHITVIIPTHNQRERLRLVLCGLACQTTPKQDFEVLVVDDGCTDGTADTVEEVRAAELPNARLLSCGQNRGRNAARNMGLSSASGELAVFLDGDALPAPDLLEQYTRSRATHGSRSVLCGEQYCLPELEYLQDPEKGALVQDVLLPSVLRDFVIARREQFAVTRDMVRNRFGLIRDRARAGGYPFEESEQRQLEAMELIQQRPSAPLAWVGFIPHNGAVDTDLVRSVGGFDEDIPFSEGWELAYRLQRESQASVYSVRAESYHLYHYHPFAGPEAARAQTAVRHRAVEHMARKHADPRIRILYFWFAHLWSDPYLPEELLTDGLLELDGLYKGLPEDVWREYEMILDQHPTLLALPNLEETDGTRA